jgi:anti-anti-sigma factor
MEMQVSETSDGLKQVALIGRLDTAGAGRIEASFIAAVVPPGQPVIVDLSQVDYIASMGVRMLLSAARGLKQKNAKLALFAPQAMVQEVFESISFSQIVPVCGDATAAIAAVRA